VRDYDNNTYFYPSYVGLRTAPDQRGRARVRMANMSATQQILSDIFLLRWCEHTRHLDLLGPLTTLHMTSS